MIRIYLCKYTNCDFCNKKAKIEKKTNKNLVFNLIKAIINYYLYCVKISESYFILHFCKSVNIIVKMLITSS